LGFTPHRTPSPLKTIVGKPNSSIYDFATNTDHISAQQAVFSIISLIFPDVPGIKTTSLEQDRLFR
jgi:hypothetical protein